MAANAPDNNSGQEIKEDAAIDKATIVKKTAKPWLDFSWSKRGWSSR